MNVKKMHAHLIVIIFIFFSCNSDNTNCKEILREVNFDTLLKCERYSYNNFYFITADYGCPYNYKDNIYGNLTFYLIPKKITKELINEEYTVYEDQIENLTIDALKSKFYLYVTIIPKQYLVETPEGYWQKEPYINQSYRYDNEIGIWEFHDCITISDKPLQREKKQEWFNHITENKEVKFLKKQLDSIISTSWQGIYSFGYGRTHMGESSEGSMWFYVNEENSYYSYYSKSLNPNTGELIDSFNQDSIAIKIVKATKDTLELKEINGDIYKIYKDEQGNFNVSGQPIYMLNPPNESYLLTKEK